MADASWRRMSRYAFSRDNVQIDFETGGSKLSNVSAVDGVRVNKEIVPLVGQAFEKALKALDIPSGAAKCYVYPSNDIQASCLIVSGSSCIIKIGSGLVERFSEDELCFVIGHELGHFILGDLDINRAYWSLEAAFISRNREISCDRLGLIACGNSEASLRAMMKTASGLSDQYLRFDLSSFISESLHEIRAVEDDVLLYSSHPPIGLRSRALLWFDEAKRSNPNLNSRAIHALNSRVEKDLDRHLERSFFLIRDRRAQELRFWFALHKQVSNGALPKREQQKLGDIVDAQFAAKAFDLLKDLTPEEAASWARQQFNKAEQELRRDFPRFWMENWGNRDSGAWLL